MTSQMGARRTAALGVLALTTILGAGLAGCGRVGPLEQPAPLLGAETKRDYYADKEARARATAARAGGQTNTEGSADRETGDDDAPLTTRDIKDPGQQLTTPRDAPVPGAPNPLGPNVSTMPQ
jgi:predicted small lipoprotein YifL